MTPLFCPTWSPEWDQPNKVELGQEMMVIVTQGLIFVVAVAGAKDGAKIAAALARAWESQEDAIAGGRAGGGGEAGEAEAAGELPVGECGGGRDGRKGGGLGRQLAAAGEK